jgi:hypothetical protein
MQSIGMGDVFTNTRDGASHLFAVIGNRNSKVQIAGRRMICIVNSDWNSLMN